MNDTTHIAEITDPVSGEVTVLEADTEQQLDELIDDHFAAAEAVAEQTAANGTDS